MRVEGPESLVNIDYHGPPRKLRRETQCKPKMSVGHRFRFKLS
jgi:hypothetical protein